MWKVLLLLALAGRAGAQVFINEIHYDNDGADSNEGVELLGPLSTDLSSYRLELYNGNGGARYGTANYIPAGAALSPVGSGFGALWVPTLDLQNGAPDGIALFNGSGLVQFLCYEGTFTASSGAASGVTCTDIGVAEAGNAPVDSSLQLIGSGCTYSDFTWTGSRPSSRGALNAGQTLDATCSTGGTAPPPPPVTPPPPPADPCDRTTWTPIYAIQGSGSSSPLVGQVVTTAGYVTSSFAADTQCGLKYTLQDAGDGVVTTSDGIYVDDTSAGVNTVKTGDFVVVRATVTESFGMTQLSSVTRVTCPPPATPANIVPVDLALLPRLSEQNALLEKYEGMLVRFPQSLVITETFTLGRFGELLINQNCTYPTDNATPAVCNNPDRTWTSTQVYTPGPDAIAYSAAQRQITLDDGRSCQNLTPNLFPFDANNTVRVGDSVAAGLTGVLLYQFSLWRIQPIASTVSIVKTNPRPASPPDVLTGGCTAAPAPAPAGRKLLQAPAANRPRPAAPATACSGLVVAAANVLNFFNGAVQPDGSVSFCNSCSESPPRDNRGANNFNEFYRQRNKTVAELIGLDAAVVGLIEIENDGQGPNSAVQNLLNTLNAQLPAEKRYKVVTDFTPALGPQGFIGTDAIANKIIYRPSAVYPLGKGALLNNTVDPTFAPIQRPSLAQTFIDLSNGGEVTVVVSHLKSKGSSCAAAPYNDPDTGGGAGNCDGVRTAAARAITRWLAGNPTNSSARSFLLLGDMNAYAREDPITAFKAANYTNLLEAEYGVTGPYSYVFDGASGYLDHALASPALVPQVIKVAEWHINADEPEVLAYPEDFKSAAQQAAYYAPTPYRSSDHDPVLVGLNLAPRPSNLINVLRRLLNDLQGLSGQDRSKLLMRLAKALTDYTQCRTQPALQAVRLFNDELGRATGAALSGATAVLAGIAGSLSNILPAAPATC